MRVQEQTGHVDFNSVSIAAVAARRARVCSRSRRWSAAPNLADEPGRSRERKIDLQGNRKSGALADSLCRSRIALGDCLVYHDG